MDEQEKLLSFDFRILSHNFLNAAKRLIWFALILAIGVGGLVYYRRDRAYTPYYASSVIFTVKANYSATTDITSNNPYLDTAAALALSQTFPYVIYSENTQQLLRMELGTDYINGSFSATSTADSGLFTMTVVSNDPQDAYDILMATISIYPQAASGILGDTQITIINQPLGPSTEPYTVNTALRTAAIYAGVAFLIGLVLIFLISLSRKTVHSAEDLRNLMNVKCLGYVPRVKLKKHSDAKNLAVAITNPHVGSAFNESIRSLRIKVQKEMDPKKGGKILLITSTLPNEGKTTIAINLALSLASEGKRVVLVDGDLRKQSLKEGLGITQPSDGLVEVLSGNSKNFRLINVPNSSMLLLSGDRTVEQPLPLLDTPRMRQVLELFRERLDYIIIDTPPAGILSDAATIAKYTDATLYVVRQDLASNAQILNSLQSFSAAGGTIVGCVLNRTQSGTTRYGYGAKYGVGYGYSQGYRYSSSYSSYFRAAQEEMTLDEPPVKGKKKDS